MPGHSLPWRQYGAEGRANSSGWLGVNEFSTLVHVEVQNLVLGEMCDTSYYIYIYSIMYGCLLIYTADIYFWRRR